MNASASPLRTLHEHYVLLADPRTRTWFFMGSPLPVVAFICFYLVFATRVGPWIMRDRKAFEVRSLVVFYNVVMIGLSAYFIYFALSYASMRKPGQSVFCWATDPRPTEDNMFFLTRAWYYMLMKAGEMVDTLFFVLRKKVKHLSFLHLLHHSLALWSVWLVLTLGMTGHVFSFPLLNSAVHVVMYGYYALAALGPALRPNLWWKKYVTLFQILQFLLLSLHALIPALLDCGISRILALVGSLEGLLFASLFSDFYIKTYVRKSALK
ncbi:very long chain fatty acid elongase 7-like [Dermacentor andersoni]|uniref:very long chain fatty acid elongase 7-like n=1 Tax=Dermacentor andersoni TaxID=34620 RepID=UPI002155E67C|nr:elongation of very long chain fatty acids protein 7-like [Dermacentor andersoni]